MRPTKCIKMIETSLVFKLFPIANCPDPFVHISFGRIRIFFFFFFVVLIPRARFRCTTPGCQLFTSGRVQHKGRNQVTANNTPDARPSTKLLKVFRVITNKKKKREKRKRKSDRLPPPMEYEKDSDSGQ